MVDLDALPAKIEELWAWAASGLGEYGDPYRDALPEIDFDALIAEFRAARKVVDLAEEVDAMFVYCGGDAADLPIPLGDALADLHTALKPKGKQS